MARCQSTWRSAERRLRRRRQSMMLMSAIISIAGPWSACRKRNAALFCMGWRRIGKCCTTSIRVSLWWRILCPRRTEKSEWRPKWSNWRGTLRWLKSITSFTSPTDSCHCYFPPHLLSSSHHGKETDLSPWAGLLHIAVKSFVGNAVISLPFFPMMRVCDIHFVMVWNLLTPVYRVIVVFVKIASTSGNATAEVISLADLWFIAA